MEDILVGKGISYSKPFFVQVLTSLTGLIYLSLGFDKIFIYKEALNYE